MTDETSLASDQTGLMRVTADELLRQGGPWLGALRSYLQARIPEGDRVTWGSGETLTLSVAQLEELGATAVAAALNRLPDTNTAELPPAPAVPQLDPDPYSPGNYLELVWSAWQREVQESHLPTSRWTTDLGLRLLENRLHPTELPPEESVAGTTRHFRWTVADLRYALRFNPRVRFRGEVDELITRLLERLRCTGSDAWHCQDHRDVQRQLRDAELTLLPDERALTPEPREEKPNHD